MRKIQVTSISLFILAYGLLIFEMVNEFGYFLMITFAFSLTMFSPEIAKYALKEESDKLKSKG